MARTDHQHDLLAAGRCHRCAERIPRAEIIRAADCPHCGSRLGADGSEIRDELETRRVRWRLVGYGLVAAASFLAGLVPLGQVVVQIAALFILHVVVLRRGLLWLPAGRRILARITIKLFGAALAGLALLINVAIAPMVGASAFVLAAVGPALTALYVEGSLAILRRRLDWESEGRSIGLREWALPVGFLVSLVGIVAATAAAAAGLIHLLGSLDIPSIGETTTWLLEVLP